MTDPRPDQPLLRVEGLVKHYHSGRAGIFGRSPAPIRAVDGVDLTLGHGETLGVVGESGCGKSTLAKTILRLEEPTAGRAWFRGEDIFQVTPRAFRAMRRHLQIVFQDPFASLNPRMRVGDLVGEPLEIFPALVEPSRRAARVRELLAWVGLDRSAAARYPHEFSGGQRQRIGIARALALEPSLIVCDEPVSALDVSVQAQVVNLLEDIQQQTGVSYLFIAHDLSVVRHVAHRVLVMYLGRVVEEGTAQEVYRQPTHPYTQALLSAAPGPDGPSRRILLDGEIPDPANPPTGCRFRTRCWRATERCVADEPALQVRGAATHRSACHHPLAPGDTTAATPTAAPAAGRTAAA